MDTYKQKIDPKKPRLKCRYFLEIMALLCIVLIYFFTPTDHLPKVEVILVSVDHFNVSASATSSSQITANWNVTLSIRNHDRDHKITYEQFDVDILHGQEFLSSAGIEPFYQDEQQQDLVYANISASSIDVANQAAQAIEYELSTIGAVNFVVTIRTKAYVSEYVPEPKNSRCRVDYEIRALCDNLEVIFLSDSSVGAMSKHLSPLPCKVTKAYRPKYQGNQ